MKKNGGILSLGLLGLVNYYLLDVDFVMGAGNFETTATMPET